jgi:hypothetical protein
LPRKLAKPKRLKPLLQENEAVAPAGGGLFSCAERFIANRLAGAERERRSPCSNLQSKRGF